MNAFALLHDVVMLADMAAAVNDSETAASLAAWLSDGLRPAFHAAFFDSACGCYGAASQTEQAMALWIAAPPTQAIVDSVTAFLVNDIVVEQVGVQANPRVIMDHTTWPFDAGRARSHRHPWYPIRV